MRPFLFNWLRLARGLFIFKEGSLPNAQNLIPSELSPALKPVIVTDLHTLQLVTEFMERVKVFSMDTETNYVSDWVERKIRTLMVGDRTEQYIIDLLAFAGSKEALESAQGNYGANLGPLQPVVDALLPFLESHDYTKVGHNLQFDYEVLRWNLGLRTQGLYDTYLAEKNIYAGLVPLMTTDFWGLENLVERYVGLIMSKDEQKGFNLDLPLTENQITYCALDVRLPMAIRAGQLRVIRADGLENAVQIDCDAASAFGEMKLYGVATDDAGWTELDAENQRRKTRIVSALDRHFLKIVGTKYVNDGDRKQLEAIEDEWRDSPQKTPEQKKRRQELRFAYMEFRKRINAKDKTAKDCEGEAFINYASNKQLLDAFRKMGYGKKKMPDTNDSTLEELAKYPSLNVEKALDLYPDLDLPPVDLLRLFRAVEKQITSYGLSWISTKENDGHRNKYTGRIHPNFNLFGTDTGRTSCSSPNVQQIPKEARFRRCFVARPGHRILTIDYSGCELRILAYLSQDPVWIDAFACNWDLHSIGAEMLFGKEWAEGAEEGCKYYAKKDKCKCKVHQELRNKVKALKD